MSEKPVIFISHSSNDKQLAEVIKEQVEHVLVSVKPDVFVSSAPDAIDVGDRWFETIIKKLQIADALIVLVTPTSVERKWVWFEIGYFWSKRDQGRGHIYPLYLPQVTAIPHPLSELQAKSLDSEHEISVVFGKLCNQFQIPECNTELVSIDEIRSVVQAYPISSLPPNLPHPSVFMQSSLYTDEELIEKLDDFLKKEFQPIQKAADKAAFNIMGEDAPYMGTHQAIWIAIEEDPTILQTPSGIFSGQVIDYRELDEKLRLPLGTSRRLLKKVAERYYLVPREGNDWDNSIRFKIER